MRMQKIKKGRIRIPKLTRAEEDCLAGFCRFFLGVDDKITLDSEKLRFNVMTDVIARNGCSGIVFSILEPIEAPWPEKELLSLRGHYFSILAVNQLYTKLAVELNEKVMRNGARCIFFKGLGLIGSAYKEQGWRPLSDIDVLVPAKESARRLVQLVGTDDPAEKSGFTRRYKEFNRLNCQVVSNRREVGLEFHFPMANPALPMSRLIELAKDDLFGGKEYFNGSLAVPEPAIHLLLLLVHLVNHHLGTRLIWHLDIAALIRLHKNDLDWDKVTGYAEAIEFLSILKAVLDSIRTRFGVDVPGFAFNRSGRVASSTINHGLLSAMTDADNVLSDRFGGRKLWESPALSIKKLKTIVFYSLFPLLFNDQPEKWYCFNFGNQHKSNMLSGLLALTFNTVPEKLFPGVRWALRFIVLPLLSLAVFPILLYFKFTAPGSHAEQKPTAAQ